MNENIAELAAAAARIAAVDGLSMRPDWLIEDLRNMADVYGNQFESAIDSLVQALSDVMAGRVSTSPLKYELEHVRSYHFQSKRAQGAKADMRIAFIATDAGIEILSIGNRFKPQDFYEWATARVTTKR